MKHPKLIEIKSRRTDCVGRRQDAFNNWEVPMRLFGWKQWWRSLQSQCGASVFSKEDA
jgi:hypothetical protein